MRHRATRGRLAHRRQAQSQQEGTLGLLLPWEVALYPLLHVARALVSVPGPCRALGSSSTHGGFSHRGSGGGAPLKKPLALGWRSLGAREQGALAGRVVTAQSAVLAIQAGGGRHLKPRAAGCWDSCRIATLHQRDRQTAPHRHPSHSQTEMHSDRPGSLIHRIPTEGGTRLGPRLSPSSTSRCPTLSRPLPAAQTLPLCLSGLTRAEACGFE